MLKRTRSISEQRSSSMNDQHAHAGDRQRTCALTNEACQILNDLRRNHLLCDANISIENPSIAYPVHRFVLAGKSMD